MTPQSNNVGTLLCEVTPSKLTGYHIVKKTSSHINKYIPIPPHKLLLHLTHHPHHVTDVIILNSTLRWYDNIQHFIGMLTATV